MHMGVRVSRLMMRASVVSVLAIVVTGCNLKPVVPFSPRADQRPEWLASTSAPPPFMPPLPTTLPSWIPSSEQPATAPATEPSTTIKVEGLRTQSIRLTLQEIIHRAVVNNKDVQVAGYDAAISKTRILENQAHFDPVAYSNVQYTDNKVLSPSSGTLVSNPFTPQVFRTLDIQTGLKQQLPSGGQVDLRYEIQRIQQTPAGSINPYFLDQVVMQITQPLLRNFGYSINQARVTIGRNDYRISVLDFRNKLEDNLTEIEKDYWQLVEAEQELHVQERLLATSQDTLRILVERAAQGGDVNKLQVSQAGVRVKNQEAILVQARGRLGDISDDIKTRMNDPEFPVAGTITILAVENAALETEVHFDEEDQVRTALLNRFDIGQQMLRIDSSVIAAEVARNNLLPKFDITGSFQVQGPGKDIGRAFDKQGRADFIGGAIGFQFEWPLGNREARSIYRRAMLQHIQAMTQYQSLIDKATNEVKGSLRAVETSWEELGRRREARLVANDQLVGYQQARELGRQLVPEFVDLLLNAEEQFAQAQRDEYLAIANYNLAISRLERAKGTLLRYNNVILEEDRFVEMER